jgi:hypothetical protein
LDFTTNFASAHALEFFGHEHFGGRERREECEGCGSSELHVGWWVPLVSGGIVHVERVCALKCVEGEYILRKEGGRFLNHS